MQITPKLFFNSYFNSFFSCYSFCCNKMFSVSFLSVPRLHYFSLQDFCLAGVTARFLLIFKYLLIKRCQPNKQMKTGGKIIHVLQYRGCDAKDCKHYTFPFKIYKSSVKESRRLRTKCDWPQWAICCRQN